MYNITIHYFWGSDYMKTLRISFSFLMLIALSAFLTGCGSKSVESSAVSTSKLSSENSEEGHVDIKKLLDKQKFELSKDPSVKYLYLAIPENNNIKIEKFELKANETKSLNVHKNKDFVLSFSGNRNINYTWNISNEVDESFIRLKEKSWSKPSFLSFLNMKSNKDRYNLYFETLRSGKQALKLRYENSKKKNSEQFEVTLVITAQ